MKKRFISICPKCNGVDIAVCMIGTLSQDILCWEQPSPGYSKNPIYGEIREWNMEWEEEQPFFCYSCESLLERDQIIFKETK